MPLPRKITKYVELDLVGRAIATFAWLEKPTPSAMNSVKCTAQVLMGIEKYQADASGMTPKQLRQEAHQSQRLGAHMHSTGDMRPHRLCDAHAIVSGAHPLAAGARLVLAVYDIRIDDPFNGCWLPCNTKARFRMPNWLKCAVPHSRIHRWHYYEWINDIISKTNIESREHLITELRMIEFKLQTSTFGPTVMKYKGEK